MPMRFSSFSAARYHLDDSRSLVNAAATRTLERSCAFGECDTKHLTASKSDWNGGLYPFKARQTTKLEIPAARQIYRVGGAGRVLNGCDHLQR